MKKKDLSLILACILCFTSIVQPAYALTNENLLMEEKIEKAEDIDSGISVMKVDGEEYQKRYKTATQLYDENGSNTGITVYVTVVFTIYEDSSGRAIKSIDSVTSSLTSGGITAKKYTQDSYSKKYFSSGKSSYTINGSGTVRVYYNNTRVKFSLNISPSDGSRY